MSGPTQVVEADLTWTGEKFERGIQVIIGSDGRIKAVGPSDRRVTHRLRKRCVELQTLASLALWFHWVFFISPEHFCRASSIATPTPFKGLCEV